MPYDDPMPFISEALFWPSLVAEGFYYPLFQYPWKKMLFLPSNQCKRSFYGCSWKHKIFSFLSFDPFGRRRPYCNHFCVLEMIIDKTFSFSDQIPESTYGVVCIVSAILYIFCVSSHMRCLYNMCWFLN